MRQARLTPAAREDLDRIWAFSVERWGTAQAERYVTELRDAVRRIAVDPRRGRSAENIRPGYLRYAAGSHTLYYRTSDDAVDIIRILHQWMEPERHL